MKKIILFTIAGVAMMAATVHAQGLPTGNFRGSLVRIYNTVGCDEGNCPSVRSARFSITKNSRSSYRYRSASGGLSGYLRQSGPWYVITGPTSTFYTYEDGYCSVGSNVAVKRKSYNSVYMLAEIKAGCQSGNSGAVGYVGSARK